jgi:putative ABC transport system permease protein
MTDIRHAIRIYLGTPVACSIAIFSLAIAMAFVSAFLTLYIDMIRPHQGFEPGGRLITVIQTDGVANGGVSLDFIERANEQVTSVDAFSGIAPFFTAPVIMTSTNESVLIAQVTREFFPDLRPRMVLGRGLRPEDHDPEAEPVVVISYPIWQDVYDGDRNVLGETLELRSPVMSSLGRNSPGGVPETVTALRIVGVISPELASTSQGDTGIWVPYERFIRNYQDNPAAIARGTIFWSFFRRQPGVSDSAVLQELNARFVDSDADLGIRPGFRLDGIEGVAFDIAAQRQAHDQLKLFLAGSVLLAIVAASNLSLFLLARAPGRRRELGIRMSVGASMKRLARQLATEAGLLVFVSSLLGVVISVWLNAYLQNLAWLDGVEWRDVSLFDWRVLSLIGVAITVLTVFVSLAPIQGLKRLGIAASSRQVAARATLAQRIAGTAQVGIACTLGGAAIAFGWHLGSMMLGDPGYSTRNLYVADISPRFSAPPSPESMIVTASRRREAILSLPGVTDIAFGALFPGPNARTVSGTQPHPVNSGELLEAGFVSIDYRYVELLGLNLVHGRLPDENEADVTLVNQTLARQVWGREDVVGESMLFSVSGGSATEIIGVLEDVSFAHPFGDIQPLYFPTGDGGFVSRQVLIESTLGTAALNQSIQGLIDLGQLEENLFSLNPLSDLRADTFAADRVRGLLTISTAMLVVLLACFGFYGTLRYLVAAGRREYAIRSALGAGPRALGRLVFGRGLLLTLPGLVIGMFCSFILVAWLRDDFVSRETSPAVVTAAVLFGLVLLFLVASLGPARQARRTQPAPLLREE